MKCLYLGSQWWVDHGAAASSYPHPVSVIGAAVQETSQFMMVAIALIPCLERQQVLQWTFAISAGKCCPSHSVTTSVPRKKLPLVDTGNL